MVVKILGICGSPIKGGNTEVYLDEGLKGCESVSGVTAEKVILAKKDIKPCIHCNWCVSKQEEGKYCGLKDDMQEIYPKLVECDGLLVATPVYIGRLSGQLSCFFDRMRCIGHGNRYHTSMRSKPGAALAVAFLRNGGLETALLSIWYGFATMEMVSVGGGLLESTSQFGAAGLSSENGLAKVDRNDKLEVLKDEFGMRGAFATGKRVAMVAKVMKTGKDALVAANDMPDGFLPKPAPEHRRKAAK